MAGDLFIVNGFFSWVIRYYIIDLHHGWNTIWKRHFQQLIAGSNVFFGLVSCTFFGFLFVQIGAFLDVFILKCVETRPLLFDILIIKTGTQLIMACCQVFKCFWVYVLKVEVHVIQPHLFTRKNLWALLSREAFILLTLQDGFYRFLQFWVIRAKRPPSERFFSFHWLYLR